MIVDHALAATNDTRRSREGGVPGKIDAFLDTGSRACWYDERSNAVMANARQLEEFIAKNKARASTATRAPLKEQTGFERLEITQIVGDEPHRQHPRACAALGPRACGAVPKLAIGFPGAKSPPTSTWKSIMARGQRSSATMARARPRFCRPSSTRSNRWRAKSRWGHSCLVGVYAQHVYTSLPEKQTVLEYLEYNAAAGTKNPANPRLGRSMVLFRGEQTVKRIAVLSGGERARRTWPTCCLASTTCWCWTNQATAGCRHR